MEKQASQPQADKMLSALHSFSRTFGEYHAEIYGEHRREHLDQIRSALQRQEPVATKYIVDVLGDGTFRLGSFGVFMTIETSDLLRTALMGGNNELTHNFADFAGPITSLLNRAVGALEAGLWMPKGPEPALTIGDSELRSRCSDLLSSPGRYDRVIREATTVLEDRIRSKCPGERLAILIPNEADRTGENLVNHVFSVDRPVLVISQEKSKRLAFHRILLGVFAYLRNPYHHTIDANTEWSWAWSTVGFIDRLLADIEGCSISGSSV